MMKLTALLLLSVPAFGVTTLYHEHLDCNHEGYRQYAEACGRVYCGYTSDTAGVGWKETDHTYDECQSCFDGWCSYTHTQGGSSTFCSGAETRNQCVEPPPDPAHMLYHVSSQTSGCDYGAPIRQNLCKEAVDALNALAGATAARSYLVLSGHTAEGGSWTDVPLGCSVQDGINGDYSAHYNYQNIPGVTESGLNGAYHPVCSNGHVKVCLGVWGKRTAEQLAAMTVDQARNTVIAALSNEFGDSVSSLQALSNEELAERCPGMSYLASSADGSTCPSDLGSSPNQADCEQASDLASSLYWWGSNAPGGSSQRTLQYYGANTNVGHLPPGCTTQVEAGDIAAHFDANPSTVGADYTAFRTVCVNGVPTSAPTSAAPTSAPTSAPTPEPAAGANEQQDNQAIGPPDAGPALDLSPGDSNAAWVMGTSGDDVYVCQETQPFCQVSKKGNRNAFGKINRPQGVAFTSVVGFTGTTSDGTWLVDSNGVLNFSETAPGTSYLFALTEGKARRL